jgi:hypothetical protein
MNQQEQSIFEEVSSFFGIKPNRKNQRLYLGAEHVKGYIEDNFKLKLSNSDHYDSVISAFNKTHKSMFLDDPDFEITLRKEMEARGIPKLEIERSVDTIDKLLDKVDKEFKVAQRKDAGVNPKISELNKVSKPEQNMEFEVVKPRKGHTMKSNISGIIPDKD